METYIERRERELEYLNQELSRTGRELAHDLETQTAKLRQTTERARRPPSSSPRSAPSWPASPTRSARRWA